MCFFIYQKNESIQFNRICKQTNNTMSTYVDDDVKRNIMDEMRHGECVKMYDGSSASPFLFYKISDNLFRCFYTKTKQIVCDYSIDDAVSYYQMR